LNKFKLLKKYRILLIFLVHSLINFAQKGEIKIIADDRMDQLVKKQGIIIPPAVNPQIYGYRVQIYFESDKKLVNEMQIKFLEMMPKIDTYIEFNAPNYVLKVGDFRTMLEAEKVRDKALINFPTSFILKEYINLPRIDRD
jgi:hypothetical protein